jgi:spermidine/putrescine transport system permease protein
MRIDRFTERPLTLKDRYAVRPLCCKILLAIVFLLSPFALCLSPLYAQSNLTYDLKVGTTGKVAVVDTFPASYAGEKVNIRIQPSAVSHQASDSLDFVFANKPMPELERWATQVYAYTDSEGTDWTVWRKNDLPKNRSKRVLVQNAYGAFEQYLHATIDVQRSRGWIWWLFAGLLLLGTSIYGGYIIWERRKEKDLTPVEQETLRRKRMGMRRHYGSQLYLWLLLLVLYAPIALIAVFSFTESKILGNWTGFSMGLYTNLFTGQADAGLNSAIWYTVVIALVAAVCSTILGTLAAIGIYNMRARQRKVVSLMNSVPMINPDIITGISLFLLFVALGVSQGLATVCIAHVVFCTPYVVLSVLPRLSRMNPNTYEAALDLGATPAQALRMVMLPELWPGMLSGFILALTLSVDDFGVTFFTKGSGGLETLSTFIYSDARKGGLTPELRPLFTIILLVMLTALIIINIRNNKQENN